MTEPAVAHAGAPRRVCFFGTYARNHTANVLLRQGFENLGWAVEEIHAPLWEETRDKTAGYFSGGSLARLGMRYLSRVLRLAPQLYRRPAADLYLAGFNGQLDAIALRLLRWPARLLFAPLVTITETVVEDRRVHGEGSTIGRFVGMADRLSLRLPNRVLIDTEAHRRYLVEQLGAVAERVACWYLGADPKVFRPYAPRRRSGPLRVLFYGQFLPLHGVETILQAMASLATDPAYEFTVVGTGPERRRALEAVPRHVLDKLRLIEWVSYEELGELIAGADLCLGTFGSSQKAHMVIPNKVYQCAAVGRAVVTADTPALREVFTPGRDIAVCAAADADALAGAIRDLRADDVRGELAAGAARLMAERFAPQEQAKALARALGPLVGH